MKKRTILTFVSLLILNSFAYSQVSRDYSERYKEEQNLAKEKKDLYKEIKRINREAYIRQLESQDLTDREFELKLKAYDLKAKRIAEQKKLIELRAKRMAEHKMHMEKRKLETLKKKERLEREAQLRRKEAEARRRSMEQLRKQRSSYLKEYEEQRKLMGLQRLHEKNYASRENFKRELYFPEKDSRTKSITINSDQKDKISFSIQARIESGSLLVEIFDPNGRKEGELVLEHGKADRRNGIAGNNTTGSFRKSIYKPIEGSWTVQVSPRRATGRIIISAKQYVKQTHND